MLAKLSICGVCINGCPKRGEREEGDGAQGGGYREEAQIEAQWGCREEAQSKRSSVGVWRRSSVRAKLRQIPLSPSLGYREEAQSEQNSVGVLREA